MTVQQHWGGVNQRRISEREHLMRQMQPRLSAALGHHVTIRDIEAFVHTVVLPSFLAEIEKVGVEHAVAHRLDDARMIRWLLYKDRYGDLGAQIDAVLARIDSLSVRLAS
jgi:hypothetical protein